MKSDEFVAARTAVRNRTRIDARCDSYFVQAMRRDTDQWHVIIVDDDIADGYTMSCRQLERKIEDVLNQGGEIL